MNHLPPEIWAHIGYYTRAPQILAMVNSEMRMSCGKELHRKTPIIDYLPNNQESHHKIIKTILFLEINAPTHLLFNLLSVAAEHNNQRFINIFRQIWKFISYDQYRIAEGNITFGALCGGNVHLIKKLSGAIRAEFYMKKIIEGGHLSSIEYIFASMPYILNKYFMSIASSYGHLHLVRWARYHNCEWNEFATSEAAKNGQVKTFKWLVNNGCPYNYYSVRLAIKNKQKCILEYLMDINPNLVEKVATISTIETNDLNFVKFMHKLAPKLYSPHLSITLDRSIDQKIKDYLNSIGVLIL